MKYFTLFILFVVAFQTKASSYFQQEVNTTIHVRLDTADDKLIADISFVYHNHSNDTLTEIWMHIWPNAYQSESTELGDQLLRMRQESFYFSDESAKGRIDKLDFTVNGKHVEWDYHLKHRDICRVKLNAPLLPNDSIEVQTPFVVKLPEAGISRLGYSRDSYQISQWFPKPAVYDNEGWHPMAYLSQGEFYSEFGSYNVFIRVPLNYKVAASGQLLNQTELDWYKNLDGKSSGSVPHPFAKDSTHKTLHYTLQNVHDFAWFANPDFIIDYDTTTLQNGHAVNCWAFYLDENKYYWDKSQSYIKRSTQFYSDEVGYYPYNNITAVDGSITAGGGMEYPTITVIGEVSSDKTLEEIIMHEIGHNWFYGMLGFNERDKPWLDEGLNTFYELLYMTKYYPEMDMLEAEFGPGIPSHWFGMDSYSILTKSYFASLFMETRNLDKPFDLHSLDYSMVNYFISVYLKPSLYLYTVREYLGREEWHLIMTGFFDEWKYRHPTEENFLTYIETHASKDISWFRNEVVHKTGNADFKFTSAKENEDGSWVLGIKNTGEMRIPVLVTAFNKDNKGVHTQWVAPFEKNQEIRFPKGDYKRFVIDTAFISSDYRLRNNQIRAKGILKRAKNPLPKLLYALPQTNRYPNNWLPVIAWSHPNKFMFGAAFYNDWVFEEKWQYRVMPLYAASNNSLNGSFQTYRNFYPKSVLQRVSLGVGGRTYARSIDDLGPYIEGEEELKFRMLNVSLDIDFKNKALKHRDLERLRIGYRVVSKDALSYYRGFVGLTYKKEDERYDIFYVKYKYERNRTLYPFSLNVDLEQYSTQVKLSAEFQYKIPYKKEGKGLRIRAFAGTFVGQKTFDYGDQFQLSSWGGGDDYLYEDLYAGRDVGIGNGMWGHQMMEREGGFAVPSFIRSGTWLASANFETTTPFPKFIRLYANVAALPFTEDVNYYTELGLQLNLIKDIVKVYIPVFYSSDIRIMNELNRIQFFEQNIRFQIDFNKLNAFEYLRRVKL